ncbi:MAG: enoyl-CoA hydratase [bacterium]|nr:enoyl-CoA hydratase [bacterium]MDE0669341.1 enoyl-CoA hydratase [bacterium]MXZ30505.1 enoyl-CoA hydratase [Acidimicrobiia bacterium]MYB24060.1 enoyl-CoA hydratase [Acidimicrobiia bacterium]MYJ13049.1 enoyl-CoA hydratase [Acidimicrobiia bacterium]
MGGGNGSQVTSHVRVSCDGDIAEVLLDNPARRNPLSLAVLRDLVAAVAGLGADPAVRVIVIAGTPPAFSAGHDLAEMAGRSDAFYEEIFDVCCELMAVIRSAPQPVVAAVDGIATAAGCQVVAACDLAVATAGSRFAVPGVRIGLFCSVPMVPLSRAIGRKRALEMLLTGDPIDAATAAEWGLVNRVVAPGELRESVVDLAGRISRFSAGVLAIGKQAFYEQLDRAEPEAYEYTRQVMAANAAMDDAQEGIGAFLAKRPAVWPAPPAADGDPAAV